MRGAGTVAEAQDFWEFGMSHLKVRPTKHLQILSMRGFPTETVGTPQIGGNPAATQPYSEEHSQE
jgi:hypothetical protein